MPRRGINGVRIPTQREMRVVVLVAEGRKNKEIAKLTGTTENVIKNYLGVIYDKIGVWNRLELALWYEANYYREDGSDGNDDSKAGGAAS